MTKPRAGRKPPKETVKEKRRRKAKETPADKAPRESRTPISERSPEATADPINPPVIELDAGDLGIVSNTLKYGRLPLSDANRERVGEFLMDTLDDEEEPTRDRLRAAQGIINAERINVTMEAAEETPAIPPTITIVSDDREYLRWRHAQAKQRREQLQIEGQADGDP